MSEFYLNWAKVKFQDCIQLFMLPWKLRKRHVLPVNQNLSSVYFSLAKFQLESFNLSLAMIWQMIYTHKLPKLCSATLKGMCHQLHVFVCLKSQLRAKQICPPSIISNVVKNKNELWKTVRLTSFQKSTTIAICFDLLQVCSFAPPFVFLCYLYFLLMAFSC